MASLKFLFRYEPRNLLNLHPVLDAKCHTYLPTYQKRRITTLRLIPEYVQHLPASINHTTNSIITMASGTLDALERTVQEIHALCTLYNDESYDEDDESNATKFTLLSQDDFKNAQQLVDALETCHTDTPTDQNLTPPSISLKIQINVVLTSADGVKFEANVDITLPPNYPDEAAFILTATITDLEMNSQRDDFSKAMNERTKEWAGSEAVARAKARPRSRSRSFKNPKPIKKKNQTKSKSFEQRLDDLRQFKEENGHCTVPYTYENNQPLSNWCSNIRYSYGLVERGLTPTIKMTKERIDALREVGFDFSGLKTQTKKREYSSEGGSEEEDGNPRKAGRRTARR
eukprot:scaffold189_cov244-Chaetoceros_neogracile.AAC.13